MAKKHLERMLVFGLSHGPQTALALSDWINTHDKHGTNHPQVRMALRYNPSGLFLRVKKGNGFFRSSFYDSDVWGLSDMGKKYYHHLLGGTQFFHQVLSNRKRKALRRMGLCFIDGKTCPKAETYTTCSSSDCEKYIKYKQSIHTTDGESHDTGRVRPHKHNPGRRGKRPQKTEGGP